MATAKIMDLNIEYELIGELGAPACILTPGGRSSKDAHGIREFAQALAERGKRVLIWDRPNCGMSDVSLDGESESQIASAALCGLVRALDLGPTVLAAGSAGSRVSIQAATLEPELFSHLVVWWVAGGKFCLQQLSFNYCVAPALNVNAVGMKGVASCSSWAEQFQRNPRARETLMAQTPDEFVRTMGKWMAAYELSPGSPIAGVSAEQLSSINMPVLIVRNSASDLQHPREVTDELARLIPNAQTAEAPWPEDEWNQTWAAALEGDYTRIYSNWSALTDTIIAFIEPEKSEE